MNALAELLPWRVRLTGRRLLTASLRGRDYVGALFSARLAWRIFVPT